MAAVIATVLTGRAQPPVTVLEELVVTGRATGRGTIPAGGLVFFPGASACPGGWTEYAAGRGRMVVGLQVGGTVGGTAGPVLTNQEVRRGGTAHSGPTISDTLSISNGLSVDYTRPSISTTSAQTSNQTASHSHNYDDDILDSSR